MFLVIWSAVILAAVTLYLRQVYSRFSKYGVKSFTPLPIFGNMARITTRLEHFADHMGNLYNAFPGERFVGRFEFLNPMVLIKDVELIKSVTVKDFEHFLDHRLHIDETVEPFFGRNLLSLKGQEWKDMRSSLSPAFTSSKIRLMVPFMVEVGNNMIKSLKMRIKNSEKNYIEVECKELSTRSANDVIASCAFGVKVDSHTDRDNLFYKMGRATATFRFWQLLKFLTVAAWPKIAKALRITLLAGPAKAFFKDLVLSTMSHRESKQIIRPDMIHLLMEAKKGHLIHEAKDVADTDAGFATVEESSVGKGDIDRVWTDSDLVAQAVLFFIAGFETISTAISFALYELALHPDIQERLFEEIKECDAKNGGKIDYTSIQNMNYLDMVISEVLRLWPPAVALDRLCIKDYNLGRPNEEATEEYIIRKGESVIIPTWAIHRNPHYYADPEKFDPERFSEGNKQHIKPFTYFPFGLGPRNCIGSRFALCEVKVMLYQILQHVELSPCEKTCVPPKLSRETFNILLKGGHWLRFKLRQQ